MIELQHLSKSYGTHQVLRNINLFVQEGEIFGIIGKSGAGKTSLLRCLNLLEHPDTGQVIIDGEDLTTLNARQLRNARHKIAMIFQQFNLLNSKTVFDNIALPMRIQGMDEASITLKVQELLTLVELSDKQHAYPAQLSGGQKQRVAIARALTCSPKILLSDEATSALDPDTTMAILDLLKKINQIYGITIVLITHELDVVKRICHRLAVMEAGQIIDLTSLADVFAKPNGPARQMFYNQLSPHLPEYITEQLHSTPNTRPLLRLFFEGKKTTVPFISQVSRDLQVDINILLANIDHFDTTTCGILIIELSANEALLQEFITRCNQIGLSVEILGYVVNNAI